MDYIDNGEIFRGTKFHTQEAEAAYTLDDH